MRWGAEQEGELARESVRIRAREERGGRERKRGGIRFDKETRLWQLFYPS